MVELTRTRLIFLLAVVLATPTSGLAAIAVTPTDVVGLGGCPGVGLLCGIGISSLLDPTTSIHGAGPVGPAPPWPDTPGLTVAPLPLELTSGTFTGGPAGLLGFTSGFMLSNGDVTDALTPVGSTAGEVIATSPYGVLDGTSPLVTEFPDIFPPPGPLFAPDKLATDTTVLELDFTTTTPGDLLIEYAYATEEFPLFGPDPPFGFSVVDTFAIFLDDGLGPLELLARTETKDAGISNFVGVDPTDPADFLDPDFVFDWATGSLFAGKTDLPAGAYKLIFAIADVGPGGFPAIDSAGFVKNITHVSTAVPEPGTLLLLGSGLVGMIVLLRRRQSKI